MILFYDMPDNYTIAYTVRSSMLLATEIILISAFPFGVFFGVKGPEPHEP